MYRGAKMTAPKVARGPPPLRHPQNLLPTPKKSSHELILEPLDANLAAQALIFEDLLINFTFFDRILMIWDGFGTDFQSFQYPQTSIFAIPYNKFKGFCMLQRIAS